MDTNSNLFHKRRPSLSNCGVMPLDGKVHRYLIGSYLMWPFVVCMGSFSTNSSLVGGVFVSFLVLGFLFYNMLVSMCLMSNDSKKRLRTGQWIFYVTLVILTVRMVSVL